MDYEFAVSCIFSRFAFVVISLLTEQLFWFVRRCAKVGHGRRLIPYHPYEGEIWQKDENAKIVVPRGNRNNPCIQKQLFTKFKG